MAYPPGRRPTGGRSSVLFDLQYCTNERGAARCWVYMVLVLHDCRARLPDALPPLHPKNIT
ncbi:MAG: hypothetical protein CME34_10630 [Gordonia sp.]|nr:hypothetical protein [Gordonia sp. (in: high G+C Gram-positive bacteria)]